MPKSPKGIDERRFEVIFREYFKPLVAFSRKFLNDTEAAKEVVHEVFAKIWEKRLEIDPEKSLKSYLFTAVNNGSLNYIRDHKKFADKPAVAENESAEIQRDFMTEAEIRETVRATLERLSPKVRRVFEMSRYEDKKYREIADELNISEKTVESHISKALKALRENLKEYLSALILILLQ